MRCSAMPSRGVQDGFSLLQPEARQYRLLLLVPVAMGANCTIGATESRRACPGPREALLAQEGLGIRLGTCTMRREGWTGVAAEDVRRRQGLALARVAAQEGPQEAPVYPSRT